METTTVAKDKQTLVIGGLVRDDLVINEKKIPFLGDIPFIGWLFKSQSRVSVKLNLLVFLTPTIVTDEVDMVELNARKSAELGTLQRESRIEEATRLKQDVLEKLERQNGTPSTIPNTADPSAPLQQPVRPE
jgi:general secretion pathway protein D